MLTISLFVILLCLTLFLKGMFLDGITYASISRNLSLGIGEFWTPHYTATLAPEFFGHPPLAFWMQSMFFSVFGDHFWVEKMYSFLMAMLTAYGIMLLWFRSNHASHLSKMAWLPLLIWMTIPICFWSYTNNLLENTMTAFLVLGVFWILKYIDSGRIRWAMFATTALLAAFLTKGPIALFPLAVPLLYHISHSSKTDVAVSLRQMVSLVCLLVLLFVLLIQFPGARNNLSKYWDIQVFPAISSELGESLFSRTSILYLLLLELAVPLGLLVVLFATRVLRKRDINNDAVFYLLLGLCAAVPIMISLKQSRFYLVPSMPFFALGFSLVFRHKLASLLQNITDSFQYVLRGLSLFGLVSVFLFMIIRSGSYSRDASLIQDVTAMSSIISDGTTIGSTDNFCTHWLLTAYMNRIGQLSIACDENHDFVLVTKDNFLDSENFRLVDISLHSYDLYEKLNKPPVSNSE